MMKKICVPRLQAARCSSVSVSKVYDGPSRSSSMSDADQPGCSAPPAAPSPSDRRRSRRPDRPVRRNARRDQRRSVEGERVLRGDAGREVAEVNRVERAAEDTQRHRRLGLRFCASRSSLAAFAAAAASAAPCIRGRASGIERRVVVRSARRRASSPRPARARAPWRRLAALGDDRPRRFEQFLRCPRRSRRRSRRTSASVLARASRARSTRFGSSSASILLAATSCGFVEQLGVVERELAADGVEVLDRIAARCARHVDQVNQHLRALDVAQELVAEPVALVRAFDQPGHVGDDEAAIAAERDDAEVRRQRGERVVGDLRLAPPRSRAISVDLPALGSRPGRRRPAASAGGAGRTLRRARPAAPCAARGWWRWRSARCPGRRVRPCASSTRWPTHRQVGDLDRARRSRDPSRRSACRPAPGSRGPCRRGRCAARPAPLPPRGAL